MGFKTRGQFSSDEKYGGYVQENAQVGMIVLSRVKRDQVKAGDIGTIIKKDECDVEGLQVMCDWIERKGTYWMQYSDIYIMGFLKGDNINVGDWVRVKHDVREPKYKWGKVNRQSIGVVKALSDDKTYFTASFPEEDLWKGFLSDVEKVPSIHPCTLCQGCKEFPIATTLYRCSTCENFCLCKKCFVATKNHPHKFYRIESYGGNKIDAGIPAKDQVDQGPKDITPPLDKSKLYWWTSLKKPAQPEAGCPPMLSTQMSITRDENEGGVKCPYYSACQRFLETLGIADSYYECRFDLCFCLTCASKRQEADRCYARGDPPMKYGLPIGWVKFGLGLPPRGQAMNVMENWHVAFHGTTKDCVEPILRTGDLLIPGDKTPDGVTLAIPKNHWDPNHPDPNMRPPEGHDVKKIYLSPSIKYCGTGVYAKSSEYLDVNSGKKYKGKVAFQVRIKPGTYSIGKQTIGLKHDIDPLFPNDSLEWSTDHRGVVILTGLIVQLQ